MSKQISYSLGPFPLPLNPPTYFLSYSTNSKDKVRGQRVRYRKLVTYVRPDPKETEKKDTYRATSL